MQKWDERIFSNQQLGMIVYIRIVMIMGLESQILPHQKDWLLRTHSRNKTFISTPQPLLMGRLTTRLITY